MLELWAASYPTGLAIKLTVGTFHGGVDELKLPEADDIAFVSGEKAASDLLHPATLALYVKKLDPRLPVANRWRSDKDPNIVVRRSFWRTPQQDPVVGLVTAPWPLVYADLLASDNPRVRGVAEEWKNQHARHTMR